MPDPSLILDTCALSDKSFINWLASYNGELSIPPVVYMERCRQYLEHDIPIQELDRILKCTSIKVLRFDKANALNSAILMNGRDKRCKECNKIDWVDTMIASYINSTDYIVTENKSDFPTSEEYKGRIFSMTEIMNFNL